MPRKPGPNKLTPQVQQILLDSVALCCSDKAACQRAGIDRETLRQWLLKGEAGDKDYTAFSAAFAQAKGDRVAALAGHIRKSALDGDWRAASWLLAVTEPQDYAETKKQEISGPGGGPIQTANVSLNELVNDDE